ncbi:MAG TPA: hypothetical protein VGK17_11555 [Propionicimonas sp.]
MWVRTLVVAVALILPTSVVAAPAPSAAAEDVITGVVFDVHNHRPLNGIRVELVVLDDEGEVQEVLASATTSGDWTTPGGWGYFRLEHSRTAPWHAALRAVDPAGDWITSYDWSARSRPFPGAWLGEGPEPSTRQFLDREQLGMTSSGRYVPVNPVRVYDSRTSDVGRPVERYDRVEVDLPQLGPASVAVVLNVTTTGTRCGTTYIAEASHVVGYPYGAESSIVNARGGADVANLTTLKVHSSDDGMQYVMLYNDQCATDLVVDLQGVYLMDAPWLAGYYPVTPERVLDTREGVGALAAGESLEIPVTDLASDVPAGAVAVAVNVTATAGTASTSYLSAYAAGDPDGPQTSVLNAYRGADVANLAIVPLSADGAIEVYNNAGEQHVVLDVQGWFTQQGGMSFWPIDHRRTVSATAPLLGPGGMRVTTDPGRGVEIPADAGAVALNLTSTHATSPTTYLTAYPSGSERPLASNLNARGGIDLANGAIVGLGSDGGWAVYNNQGSVQILEDVAGWFAPSRND